MWSLTGALQYDSDFDLHVDISCFRRILHRGVTLATADLTHAFNLRDDEPVPGSLAFENTWLHVLMDFVMLADSQLKFARVHMRAASRWLGRGNLTVTAQLRPVQLRKVEMCLPAGMAALCVADLVKTSTSSGKEVIVAFKQAMLSIVSCILSCCPSL